MITTDPATEAAPVPAAPATAIDVAVGSCAAGRNGNATRLGVKTLDAETSSRPAASALPAMNAMVDTGRIATAADPPIEAPFEKAPAAARVCTLSALLASTVKSPVETSTEPPAAEAWVSNRATSISATDPAIPADPELPPADAAHATMLLLCAPPLSGSGGVIAWIETPSPLIVEPLATAALFVATMK